jgi:predicted dehydrogenase
MVKMGLIGAGTMGAMYARAYSQHPEVEFAAVCDLDLKRARSLARRFAAGSAHSDAAVMLKEAGLNAVTVATPDALHREPVIACLRAGKDVLCEKPLATTMRDCEAICAAAGKSGRRLMVNYGNRHKTQVYALKEQLGAGKLGRVENAFIRLREPLWKTKNLAWLEQTTPTWFLLSHCTDTLVYLLGAAPTEVHARATRGVLAGQNIDTPDAVVAMLGFGDGATAVMDANWVMPRGFAPEIDFRLELIGEKGAFYADLRSIDMMLYTDGAKAVDYDLGKADPLGRTTGWWYRSVGYFVECLIQGIEPHPNAEEGMDATRILLAIEKSAQTGKVVPIR